MRQRRLVLGLAALLVLAAFIAGLGLSSRREAPTGASPSPAAVQRLFAESFVDLAGNVSKLSAWRGKPLIVNFWATWCPPCLAEMPIFSRLQDRHKNVQFVGIAVDNPDNVRTFTSKNKVSYPLLLASDAVMSLMSELGNDRSGLPFTVGIDAGGQVRHIHLGALSQADAEGLIVRLQAR